ncbi:helix-turn-helix transcriptional regulator [Paenibacillus solani]|nr:helix-turn-helix transcriptional regulator [Paenibacillus solani]
MPLRIVSTRHCNTIHGKPDGEGITREELAKLYHMNPVYFSRAFQKIYKLTPMQMVRKLRLQHAKKMLESTDYTLEHIAQKCGYFDASTHLKS